MRGCNLTNRVEACKARLRRTQLAQISGTVTNLLGLVVEVEGLTGLAAIGDRLALRTRDERLIPAEVIGFRDAALQAMAFGALDGLAHGAKALLYDRSHTMLDVASSWLGRVIDPLGNPLDRAGILLGGSSPRPTRIAPPDATARARLGPRIDLGVRALNCFATCRQGQRLGLFAGSGVGKSTLLSMLTRGTQCDVAVLALVGERGREVRDFIENDLGPDGMARSVVVVATSDAPPLMRRQCAYTAMTVAEHFRDQGLSVLLLMDSVTRFCLALREIGLSLGEPPATRGYPPSVFAELPRLLERAGPGPILADDSAGQITGLFSVLVEGDDHNEPVADAIRGILDGQVVMDRKIAEAGRYPAIDILRSLSRVAASCLDDAQAATICRARAILSLYGDMVDMVRLGAYRPGTDPAVDEALRLTPAIEDFLRQAPGDRTGFDESFQRLNQALGG
ncbi:FliI/YscN family ATPase [Acidisphaera sp. S103]|uniref:FliI/YscN family ATPase n=1 Tax=Acidisphaera sp. S103 TaxID=1747223 RepID=UPI00131B9692|nr:FliI/YscN family ATPase [Acidisphaera sp. S103]